MSENIIQECETRLNSLQRGIETATGESYNDLTEAVKGAVDCAVFKNIIQESIYANHKTNSAYNNFDIFTNTSVKDVSMFDFSKVVKLNYSLSGCTALESLEINISSATTMQYLCQNCHNIKSVNLIGMTDKVLYIPGAFFKCYNLEEIKLLNVAGISAGGFGTNTSNYTFGRCDNLKEIRFVPECIKVSLWIADSPLLSDESIQNIIEGLATVETAQTLTLHKNVKAKLTAEQLATITNKNWSVA